MKFYKYCGAGNDFILLEDLDDLPIHTNLSEFARKLCAPHFGIGADGLIVLEPAEHDGDCKMRFFNCDGSDAELCGNGARCVCKHCCDRGIAGETQRIETPSGMVIGSRISENQYQICLPDPCAVREFSFGEVHGTYLELGKNGIPHAVVVADLSEDRAKLRDFARNLRNAKDFPRGANVNLCSVKAENILRLLTYERGVEDFTLACGSGTGATVAALTRLGTVSGRQTVVETDGGTLTVDVNKKGLFLTGPAERVYVGETNPYIGRMR